MSAPLDLSTALSSASPAQPGDTIWLRGGLYRGAFVSELQGTSSAPIVVRQYPGERATIDSDPLPQDALFVKGAYTWFWGFEIRSSAANRVSSAPFAADISRGGGVASHAPGAKFINLVIHDMIGGIGMWISSPDSEAYGNLIYHNGYVAADRGHGHGIYAQNRDGSQRFADNILFGGFSHGIHAYGSDAAYLNNFDLEGNIIFNSGVLGPYFGRNILIGGGRIAENPLAVGNLTYYADRLEHPGGENNFGYSAGCTNLVVRDNYFAHLRKYPLALENCGGAITNNVLIGWTNQQTRAQYPANTFHETSPGGVRVFVRPNRYEPGRANLAIYNWDERPIVDVDLSAAGLAIGDAFELRDAQNFFGPPVVTGVFAGSPVAVPMTPGPVVQPIGYSSPMLRHTAPQFGAFIVMRAEEAEPAPTDGPDLVLDVTAPAQVPVDEPFNFTAHITNRGRGTATLVRLVSSLPAGTAWTAMPASQGSCAQAVEAGDCQLGTLGPGDAATATFTIRSSASGALVHSTTATSFERDEAAVDNAVSGTLTTVLAPPPPSEPAPPGGTGTLQLTQTASTTALAVGDTAILTLTVLNTGSSPAGGVVVTTLLQAQPWVVRSVAFTSGCLGGYPVVCNFGTIPAGASATAELRVTTGAKGSIVSTATVSPIPEGDPAADYTASLTLGVGGAAPPAPAPVPPPPAPEPPPGPAPSPAGGADVSVAQTSTLVAARQVELRISVANGGPNAAGDIEVSTRVQAQPWVIQSLAAMQTPGIICQGNYPIKCRIAGTIPAGGAATFVIRVNGGIPGSFISTASVITSATDANSANNTAVVSGSFN